MEIYYPSRKEKDLSKTTHLAIAAHPDDIELMAADGILACYKKADLHFTGVVVTDGAGSPRTGRYEKVTDEKMCELRKKEQKEAAKIGKYLGQIFLDYQSAGVKLHQREEVTGSLLEVLEKTKPKVVYLHNLADKHDTHVATALRAIEAMRCLQAPPEKVYGCEVWRSLDWLLDDEKVVADLSKHQKLLRRIMGVFDSQIAGGKRYDLAIEGRRRANATFSASHSTDLAEAASFLMDLTPLIKDKTLSPLSYIEAAISRFGQEVQERIEKLQR